MTRFFDSPRRRWRPLLSALTVGLVLAGCASTRGIHPEGRLLDADALSSPRSLAGAKLSEAAFPHRDWWTASGDPQLDALIAEALASAPSLDAADARVRQAVAQAGLADAARQPSVGAGAQYSGVLIPEAVAPEPIGGEYRGVGLLTLNLKYSPDLWGGHRARWEAALGQARAAEVDAQGARLTLASNLAQAYVGLAQAHALHDVALADQARASKLLGLGQQRVKAGLDNQLQVRQAQAGVASAQQQAQAADQQIDAARNAIAALLGQGPDRGLQISKPILLAADAPALPSLLPSELLGHRPDVVAARWRVEAARRGIDVSRAEFYPTVNLAAMLGLASGHLSDLFTSDALLVQGGPAISLPIFDGGRLRNTLARSDADFDLAVASYNGSLVSAMREVADALQSARSTDAQLASTRQARDAAQSALTLATSRYRAGLGNQLDVLAAQKPLLQFDQQLAALQAQRLRAAIDLQRALGGGLTPVGPDTIRTVTSTESAKASTP